MDANFFSAYASMAATLMLLRTLINDMVPYQVRDALYSFFDQILDHFLSRFVTKLDSKVTIVVDEEIGMNRNEVFEAAETYLRTIINPNSKRLKAAKTVKQKSISLNMEKGEEVFDSFKGIQLKWQFYVKEQDNDKSGAASQKSEKRFELTFSKAQKQIVVDEYLPFVLSKSKEMKSRERPVKLYTRDCRFDEDDDGENCGCYWGAINLDHPATFEKLAMDWELKQSIIDDLDRFVRRKEYYRKVGKAWKRGYLLYGPPGTGKSTLIAAIANYLKFDVYDLELSSVYDNRELRSLLLYTKNKSIVVIEDIDCSSTVHDRTQNSDESDPGNPLDSKVTLSGILNFIDGMWSSCGDERIFIFTTNHKEKLDPALLRPGRMDMHIHLGYCTPQAFDVLVGNYLGDIGEHQLLPQIKGLIKEVEITPAAVAEQLMRHDVVDMALQGVVDLIEEKKKEKGVEMGEETREKKLEPEEQKETETQFEVRKKKKTMKFLADLVKSRTLTMSKKY